MSTAMQTSTILLYENSESVKLLSSVALKLIK